LRVDRVIVLTPKMAGADGISEMTRQWVRILESRIGHDFGSLDVWSLDDGPLTAQSRATTFRTAGGSRSRFVSYSCFDGFGSSAKTLVIVMHLQLLPVALPLVWRDARLVPILMGIEAWVPLSSLVTTMLRQSWKVAAISNHTLARFRAANPLADDVPISVCRPGAPTLPTPGDGGREDEFALIVGRMCSRERYKGHDVLIEVWPLVRRVVAGARLVIAGDGDDARRLRAKAGEGIEFTGRVDQTGLAALYRDAAFFVMPSTDEGLGLVYLEAMRASTPCIAAHGAAEEIITDGRDGLIVDADDRGALVAAIVKLFVDREGRGRLGIAAAHRVECEFGQAALERRICSVLELGDGKC
jgi:glycosyltransferase involved in cell wall biosynthesis